MMVTKRINESTFYTTIRWEGWDTSRRWHWIAYAKNYEDLWWTLVHAKVMDNDDYVAKVLAKSGHTSDDFWIDTNDYDDEAYYKAMEVGLTEFEYRELIEESKGNAYYQEFHGMEEDDEDDE